MTEEDINHIANDFATAICDAFSDVADNWNAFEKAQRKWYEAYRSMALLEASAKWAKLAGKYISANIFTRWYWRLRMNNSQKSVNELIEFIKGEKL